MFYIFKEFCNRRCSFNILSTTQKKIKGVVWVLKHGNSMQELTSCYSNCSTRFKGTATLGSPGDSRYPDELAIWRSRNHSDELARLHVGQIIQRIRFRVSSQFAETVGLTQNSTALHPL
jgi:hypothetical protein